MNSYKIEFEVVQRSTYYACVDANSPEEALQLYKDHSWDYDSEEETLIDSEDLLDTMECVGVWELVDREDDSFSELKRYDEPIKLNK